MGLKELVSALRLDVSPLLLLAHFLQLVDSGRLRELPGFVDEQLGNTVIPMETLRQVGALGLLEFLRVARTEGR